MTAEEFKHKVLPIKNKIYRFALRMLVVEVEAEDVTQEVFIKLWNRKESLTEYRSIEAFAMTITKNICLDKIKLRKNISSQYPEKADMNTPFKKYEQKEAVNQIKDIIDQLPEQQKMIIHMRDIEGCDYDEIAEVMKMSLNTVRVNLSRARKKVRDEMIKTNSYEFSKN